jgi:hypothetical protein
MLQVRDPGAWPQQWGQPRKADSFFFFQNSQTLHERAGLAEAGSASALTVSRKRESKNGHKFFPFTPFKHAFRTGHADM